MKLSDFNPIGTTLQLIAGDAITKDDLVEVSALTGKVYPVEVSDYSAVPTVTYGTAQTSTATGEIVATTYIVLGNTLAYARQQVLVNDTDKSIYTLTNHLIANGLLLTRFTPNGDILFSVDIDATATAYNNHHMFYLSNGNIAVVAMSSTSYYYAIYDTSLNVVTAKTTSAETCLAAGRLSAIALSGGGFAVVFQQLTNPLLSRLATYDNAGAIVLAATTIWTRTGTTGPQYHKIEQLSSGNIVVAVSSANTVASIGLFHGIVTTGGVSVLAFTNLDTTSAALLPELSILTGYYCIARKENGTVNASVFNNAGTIQGAETSTVSSTSVNENFAKLVNNSVDTFWLLCPSATPAKTVLVKIPITGTNYVTTAVQATGTLYDCHIDAFYDDGFIICTSTPRVSASAPVLWIVDTTTGLLVTASATTFGSMPGSYLADSIRVIYGGTGVFICVYAAAATGPYTALVVGKYANTAIIGVAGASANEGSLVPIYQSAGAYKINELLGSTNKSFDNNTTTQCYGNKGTMIRNSVVLRGI